MSQPVIGFRGGLTRRHSPTTGWSLTTYLKVLHAGGMTWEAIYWHVWAACVIMRPVGRSVTAVGKGAGCGSDVLEDYTICGLDVDRYSVESDGILLFSR